MGSLKINDMDKNGVVPQCATHSISTGFFGSNFNADLAHTLSRSGQQRSVLSVLDTSGPNSRTPQE